MEYFYESGLRSILENKSQFKRELSIENEVKYNILTGLLNMSEQNDKLLIIYNDNDGTFKSMMDKTLNYNSNINNTFAFGKLSYMTKEYIILEEFPQIWSIENIVDATFLKDSNNDSNRICRKKPIEIYNFYRVDSKLNKINDGGILGFNAMGAYLAATKKNNKPMILESIDKIILKE